MRYLLIPVILAIIIGIIVVFSGPGFSTKTIDHVSHGPFATTWYSIDGYHTMWPQDDKTMASKGDDACCIWVKN